MLERTLKNTFLAIENKELLLPDFQREYKWAPSKQQNLLASILLRFPVGGCLILKGTSNEFAARIIGEKEQTIIESDYNCEFLLDGQQRTTTMYNAFNDIYNYQNFPNEKKLIEFLDKKATHLKNRWFLQVPVATNNIETFDMFNALNLFFSVDSLEDYEPDDILQSIKNETFDEKNRKGTTKWFSPFNQLKDNLNGIKDKKISTTFVDECSERGMLPLFLLGSSIGVSLIKRILKNIGIKNAQALKDDAADDFQLLKKYDTEDLLCDYDSELELLSDGEKIEGYLDQIFEAKVDEWKNDVANYLVKDIYEDYVLHSLETDDVRRAIPIFCHLNEGGMPLDDFDLVAARTAKKLDIDVDTYSLSKTVREHFNKVLEIPASFGKSNAAFFSFKDLDVMKDGLPRSYVSQAILSITTILCSQTSLIKKEHTSSKTLLNKNIESIRKNVDIACLAVKRALAFLSLRCGVYNTSQLHYKLMLQPIAYVFTNDKHWMEPNSINKLEYWYWVAGFSGLYVYDQSTQVIKDINSLFDWIENDITYLDSRKDKILALHEYSDLNTLLCKSAEPPKEAIRSFILQYVLSAEPTFDFESESPKKIHSYKIVDALSSNVGMISNSDQKSIKLEDHHIIPLSIVKEIGLNTSDIRKDPFCILNSPLNRVLISEKSNRAISSLDPGQYFDSMQYSNSVISSNIVNSSFRDAKLASISGLNSFESILEERFHLLKSDVETRLLNLNQMH
jgi:hypothetical protein